MLEPGMNYYRVRLTRNGAEAGEFFVFAFDVDDAVARAKSSSANVTESLSDGSFRPKAETSLNAVSAASQV